ncbi:MAG: gamma-glutamyl-phosphate reductase, partial [Chthoniobacterales bacterium]
MTLPEQILDFGQRARRAARALAQLSSEEKSAALRAMADEVVASAQPILAANEKDLARARETALAPAMVDRLTLNHERLTKMAEGIRQVASLPDPVGEVLRQWTRPN